MEQNKKRNTKKKVAAGTVLAAALILLAGTFMWWSSEHSVANNLKLGYIDVRPVEKFPDGEVEPGIELTKEVYASNTGTADAAVRMFFEESIQFVDYDEAAASIKATYAAKSGLKEIDGAEALIVKYSAEAFEKIMTNGGYTVFATDEDNNGKAYIKDLGEGETDILAVAKLEDGSYQIASYENEEFTYAYYVRNGAQYGPARFASKGAIENLEGTKPAYEMDKFRDYVELKINKNSKWSDQLDGYYYYKVVLESGDTTEKLLDSVKFAYDLPDSWQGAKYVIDVTVQAEQAIKEAVTDSWGKEAADIIEGLK